MPSDDIQSTFKVPFSLSKVWKSHGLHAVFLFLVLPYAIMFGFGALAGYLISIYG